MLTAWTGLSTGNRLKSTKDSCYLFCANSPFPSLLCDHYCFLLHSCSWLSVSSYFWQVHPGLSRTWPIRVLSLALHWYLYILQPPHSHNSTCSLDKCSSPQWCPHAGWVEGVRFEPSRANQMRAHSGWGWGGGGGVTVRKPTIISAPCWRSGVLRTGSFSHSLTYVLDDTTSSCERLSLHHPISVSL